MALFALKTPFIPFIYFSCVLSGTYGYFLGIHPILSQGPILIENFSQSSFNRESAVDVDFEKAEEERWKRHSYAANETQQSSDDVFDNPRLVLISVMSISCVIFYNDTLDNNTL